MNANDQLKVFAFTDMLCERAKPLDLVRERLFAWKRLETSALSKILVVRGYLVQAAGECQKQLALRL